MAAAQDIEDITERLRQTTLTKSDWHLEVLIANGKGNNKKFGHVPGGRGYIPNQRRLTIQCIVSELNPDLVLFQEFKNWHNVSKPKKYKFTNEEPKKNETSILYKSHLEVSDKYATTDRITILESIELPSERLQKTIRINPKKRMCVRVISIAAETSFKLICISWHGPYIKNGRGRRGRLSNQKKIEYFKYLMKFLENIREKFPRDPMLVGGDFNIAMNKIEGYVSSPFKLCEYEASERRTRKGIIDYFIFTDDLELEDTKYIDLQEYDGADSIFDHDPIITSVKASTTSTTEAAV